MYILYKYIHIMEYESPPRSIPINAIDEENRYIAEWLYKIGKNQGHRKGFAADPRFLKGMYKPFMRSTLRTRTNEDIKDAVNLWCRNPDIAEKQYGHISVWDVSSVTDMSTLFQYKEAFNDDISRWDVSNVTDMSHMFNFATAFNQPIGGWDVSNVEYMTMMFDAAAAFNQPIGDWKMSKVYSTSGMFNFATAFNQPIGDWDVSNVTGMDFMFCNAFAFNQPIGGWNVSNVNFMRSMFYHATSFNQDLRNWSIPNEPMNVIMMFEDCPILEDNKPRNVHDVVMHGGAKKTNRSRRAMRKRSRKSRRTKKRGTRRRRM